MGFWYSPASVVMKSRKFCSRSSMPRMRLSKPVRVLSVVDTGSRMGSRRGSCVVNAAGRLRYDSTSAVVLVVTKMPLP